MTRLRRAPFDRLGNTSWAFIGELTPLVASSILFFLLVAFLSPLDYGLFVAVTAIAFIATPLARAGASIILLRDLGEQREEQPAWDNAFMALTVGLVLAVIGWAALTSWILPTAPFTISILLFAQQLVPLAYSELCNALFIVKLKMPEAFLIRLTLALWRIAGLAIFAVVRSENLELLAGILLVLSMAGAIHNLRHVQRILGLRTRAVRLSPRVLLRGMPDSFNSATGSILDSVDKPILYDAGYAEDTARYGVAMRLVSIVGVPTIALLRTYDRDLFQAGAESVTGATRVMIAALRRTVPVGILSAAVVWALAGFLPEVLPAKYAEAADIVRWGVWMMPLRAVSFPFGNALTASGHRGMRLGLTAIAAFGNAVANLALIPRYSWHAAIGTTLAAESFLAVASAAGCLYWSARERREDAEAMSEPIDA